MKRTAYLSLALLILAGAGAALVMASRPGDGDIPEDVLSVFEKNCVRCHTGPKPPKGLSLIPAKIAAAIEAPSAEVPAAMLIVPGDPGASYLIKKVRRDEGIAGKPMPPGKALAGEELRVLGDWISGLK